MTVEEHLKREVQSLKKLLVDQELELKLLRAAVISKETHDDQSQDTTRTSCPHCGNGMR